MLGVDICVAGHILPYTGAHFPLPLALPPKPPPPLPSQELMPMLCLSVGDRLIPLGSQRVVRHSEAPFQVRHLIDVRYYLMK